MAMVKDDILDLSMGKVPMLKALFLYVLGIVMAVASQSVISPFVCLIVIVLAIGVYFLVNYLTKYNRRNLFSISFSVVVICFGYFQYATNQSAHITSYYSNYKAVQYIGIIDDEPVIKERTIRFPVRIQQAIDSSKILKAEGKVMLTILRDSLTEEKYAYGDQIVFVNKLADVNPSYNPKEFDYRYYLANKGIKQQSLLTGTELKVLNRGKGNNLIAYSLELRTNLIAKFRKYIQDDEAFNVAVALIFGYRSQIDQNTISVFTNTGTIHVLSVSGFHVSLVFALLNLLLFWMDRFRYGKFIKSILILLFIWSYVILTGMSPPILRAGIMISFFVFSKVINRKQIPLNTLAASAFFILLFSPNYLFDVGFQLSYMAILGIILLYPILKNYYITPNKWCNYVLEYTYVSIAAQLFTLPLTLYYFGQFPNYFLMANLFIAIPSTLIMYVGMGLAILPFEWTISLFGVAIEWLLNLMMSGLKWMEHLPFAVVHGVDWHWSQVLLLGIGIASLIIALNSKSSKSFLVVFSSIFLLSVFNSFQYFQKSSYKALKFYSVRSEIGVAFIHENQVVLYSKLDSVNHPTLQYSVLPDLRQYMIESDIEFKSLPDTERHNRLIEIGKHKILILEKKIDDFPVEVDFVLWRKNNYSDSDSLLSLYPKATFIVDGSNSEKTLERLKNAFASNSDRLYILKNNFAYVWEED